LRLADRFAARLEAVAACRDPTVPQPHTSHFTLHTSYFTLPTSHFSLLTSHFSLHTLKLLINSELFALFSIILDTYLTFLLL
ncbi:MAG: hypothetical protein K2K97_04470, partial [Muribaculaceae bacterium]|nr:hypothetical protein [Muribaculaceae bacterium]